MVHCTLCNESKSTACDDENNKPDQVRKEDLEKFIHEQPVIFSKRGAAIGQKYGESKVGQAIGCALGKEASVEVKIAFHIHSVVTNLARQLGRVFMDLMIEANDESGNE